MNDSIKNIFRNKLLPATQRILLGINALQMGFLSYTYIQNSFANKFPVFERLFSLTIINTCTSSGCWQTLTPFLASTYASIALLSLFACLFFRADRELRFVLFVTAFMHIMMGWARLSVVPTEFYQEFTASKASHAQFIFGGLLLISALIPYSKKDTKDN